MSKKKKPCDSCHRDNCECYCCDKLNDPFVSICLWMRIKYPKMKTDFPDWQQRVKDFFAGYSLLLPDGSELYDKLCDKHVTAIKQFKVRRIGDGRSVDDVVQEVITALE